MKRESRVFIGDLWVEVLEELMRSELELDAEVRRLRRSMRRLLGALTLALFVGIAVVVAVVGASLTTADKQALQAFTGSSHKPDASKAAKADAGKDARQPAGPVRETTGQAPAAPQPPAPTATAAAPPKPAPAPVSTAATALAPPATATPAAAPQPPAPAATGAVSQPPAAAEPHRTAEPKEPKKSKHQRAIARARPSDDTERDASANTDDRARDTSADRSREQTQTPADTAARERPSHRRYVRTRPADQDRGRTPDDNWSDRGRVVVIDRGPGYLARGPVQDGPPRDARRDGRPFGMFGTLFGRPDRDDE